MAKLNGVKLVLSEKITYNGADYVKTDAVAKVGDIVRSEIDNCRYLPKGAFYNVIVDTTDGEPIVLDEEGDECSLDDDDFTVFAKVEAAAAPVQYREVKRKATVGERIKIVDAGTSFGAYKNGDVLTVKPWEPILEDFGMVRAEGVGCGIFHREYVVLEPVSDAKPALPTSSALPTSLPSDYVIHDGAVYRKEARKAEVGEMVVVTEFNLQNHLSTNPVKNGNVYKVARIDTAGDVLIDDNHYVYQKEYAVLVPTDIVTLNGVEYTLEKRPATKGESVLVTTSHFVYKSADIVSLQKNADPQESGHINYANGEYGMSAKTYLVLTPKAAAKQTEPERLKVGDYAKVVSGAWFNVGDIVKVVRIDEEDYSMPYRMERIKDGHTLWVNKKDVASATDAEVAVAKRNGVKVGDYVRITQSECSFPAGTIVKVTEIDTQRSDGNILRATDGKTSRLTSKYEPVTPAEAEAARKQAEEVAKKSAEEAAKQAEVRKWTAIGRKVGEYKVGDVVKITGNSTGSVNKVGELGVIAEGPKSTTGNYRVDAGNGELGNWTAPADMELVAPVESLFNVKEA